MADLDPTTATALCRALERVLVLELRQRVVCNDISARSWRWDIEARDVRRSLIRRVSYTQVVPERMAMAGAELRDVRDSLEGGLRDLGVSGIGLSLTARACRLIVATAKLSVVNLPDECGITWRTVRRLSRIRCSL